MVDQTYFLPFCFGVGTSLVFLGQDVSTLESLGLGVLVFAILRTIILSIDWLGA